MIHFLLGGIHFKNIIKNNEDRNAAIDTGLLQEK